MLHNEESPVQVLNVLIVDDHTMLRDGLKNMLLSLKKEIVLIVTEAASGEKALQKMVSNPPDLVIVDYKLNGMPGPELIRRMLRYQPQIKVLALSNYSEYSIIEAMMDAGALGYVLKTITPEQLLLAIRTVMEGRNYYCNEVALVLLTEAAASAGAKKAAQYKLTPREIEIMLLIADGMKNEDIAKKLFLARRTVDTHRQNLLTKLNVKNTAGLVRFALELRLLK